MKLRGRFGVVMLTLAAILVWSCGANASGMVKGGEQQGAQAGNSQIIRDNQDVNSSGAMRVDRDLQAAHNQDSDQFGGDEAYKSTTGRINKEADNQKHHWAPESYGLTGNYGRDSR